jgi:2-keto-4-pentenoate hydratase/2-oxohepta-3-ene-1,7-dioic acid hydratase in catechol pathway
MKPVRIGPVGGEQPAVLSQFLVLRPGDIVDTGTPAGGALCRSGSGYLLAGDTMRLEIDRLGARQQTLGAA